MEREREMADIKTGGEHVVDLTTDSPKRGGRAAAGDEGFIRQRLFGLKLTWLGGDLAMLMAGFVLVSAMRYGANWMGRWDQLLPGWELLVPMYAFGVAVMWWRLGMYRIYSQWSARDEMKRALQAGVYLLVATMALLFIFNLDHVSRLMMLVYAEVVVLWAGVSRVAGRAWLRRRRAEGKGTTNVLIVGGGLGADRYLEGLAEHPEAGMRVIGQLCNEGSLCAPSMGRIDDLGTVLASEVVDEVVVCLPFEQWGTINEVARVAEEQGKSIRIPVWMLDHLHSTGRLEQLGGMPVLSLTSTPNESVAMIVKRLMDVVGAVVGLTLAAPVLGLVAVAMRVKDPGPFLFSQTRVGLHGRPFQIYKIRTMVVDAEARLAEVAHLNERQGPAFKAENDPRITPLGRILRKASIDELPQLWNVLIGDMSLVGPRPPLPHEVSVYDAHYRRRLSMKPGVTGLWQVTARREGDFESWVQLDLSYIDSWSIMGDLLILSRTIPAVAGGQGD